MQNENLESHLSNGTLKFDNGPVVSVLQSITVEWSHAKKSISQEFPMFGYGHFQAYNLFQLTKYGTSSVPRKVFWCAELFSKVSRATGCQKVEEI